MEASWRDRLGDFDEDVLLEAVNRSVDFDQMPSIADLKSRCWAIVRDRRLKAPLIGPDKPMTVDEVGTLDIFGPDRTKLELIGRWPE